MWLVEFDRRINSACLMESHFKASSWPQPSETSPVFPELDSSAAPLTVDNHRILSRLTGVSLRISPGTQEGSREPDTDNSLAIADCFQLLVRQIARRRAERVGVGMRCDERCRR